MTALAEVQTIISEAIASAQQAQDQADTMSDKAVSFAGAIATPEAPPSIPMLSLDDPEAPSIDLAQVWDGEVDARMQELKTQVESDLASFLNSYYPCGWISTGQKICEKVRTAIDEGGTGLAPAIEQAIFDRARAREQKLNEKMAHAVSAAPAAYGWELPPGAVTQRQFEAAQNEVNRDSTLSREVMIYIAEKELEMLRYFVSTGVQMQGLIINSAFNFVNAKLRAFTDPAVFAEGLKRATQDFYTQSLQFHRAQVEVESLTLRRSLADVQRSLDTARIAIAAIESRARNQTEAAMAAARVQGDIAASARSATNTMATVAHETTAEE